ncbi:hypothetical protein ZHAS_00012441 [Anopheles sinensis]|uniref:Uncharacterized protein n=1 Tax=Anopheles sinensis TaxID=74873 RepID=A0A084W2U2_ANOSI|nr:hypothetical protein ZHAS_00012441 [Anopheles sinensis]
MINLIPVRLYTTLRWRLEEEERSLSLRPSGNPIGPIANLDGPGVNPKRPTPVSRRTHVSKHVGALNRRQFENRFEKAMCTERCWSSGSSLARVHSNSFVRRWNVRNAWPVLCHLFLPNTSVSVGCGFEGLPMGRSKGHRVSSPF